MKDGRRYIRHLFVVVQLQKLKYARANASGHAQNDALRDAVDGICLAIVGRIEQMIRRLLELNGESNQLDTN